LGEDVPEVMDLRRLRLRRPVLSDASALFECGNDIEVARYASWPLGTSLSEVAERIAQRAEGWASGAELYWVITLAEEDRPIGAISCRVEQHAAEFGFFIHRAHWRNGYATEAARAIVDWAMSVPTIWRVWATCDVENTGSARVLEKAGLAREGTLRRWIVRPNLSSEPRDAHIYSRVR
jgi:RimJ/RimL family protein N-acetyltransferase